MISDNNLTGLTSMTRTLRDSTHCKPLFFPSVVNIGCKNKIETNPFKVPIDSAVAVECIECAECPFSGKLFSFHLKAHPENF